MEHSHAAGHGMPGGLQVSQGGYTIELRTRALRAGEDSTLSFAILDEKGQPVVSFASQHGMQLHLILAARDMATYRHLHPVLAADGTWTAPVSLPRAGDYRVLADFVPETGGSPGTGVVLGADLAIAGEYLPRDLPAASGLAEVDGYAVTLDGALVAGATTDLTMRVSEQGSPVTDLEPYLDAHGHLVALRAGDLAYLHIHPHGGPGDGVTESGPGLTFSATAPSPGTYRLFLDFKHRGQVRTAEFTATVSYRH